MQTDLPGFPRPISLAVKDPGIRLVPAGGGGWGRKKEDRNKSGGLGGLCCQPSNL